MCNGIGRFSLWVIIFNSINYYWQLRRYHDSLLVWDSMPFDSAKGFRMTTPYPLPLKIHKNELLFTRKYWATHTRKNCPFQFIDFLNLLRRISVQIKWSLIIGGFFFLVLAIEISRLNVKRMYSRVWQMTLFWIKKKSKTKTIWRLLARCAAECAVEMIKNSPHFMGFWRKTRLAVCCV